MYDFSKTEAAKENSFLKPGIYKVKVTEVKLGAFPQKGTKYLGVTFQTEEDLTIEEKFILSEKALPRLQYFHEAWTNKKLDKVFKSEGEVESYFKKAFVSSKAGTRNLIVGGEINGKVIYGQLPYTGFLPGDDAELGEFEEGDDNWKKYVHVSTRANETAGKGQGLLNTAEKPSDKGNKKGKDKATETAAGGDDTTDDGDDMPW